MASIEGNLTIYIPDDFNPNQVISAIETIFTQINGLETKINITELDDPISAGLELKTQG